MDQFDDSVFDFVDQNTFSVFKYFQTDKLEAFPQFFNLITWDNIFSFHHPKIYGQIMDAYPVQLLLNDQFATKADHEFDVDFQLEIS